MSTATPRARFTPEDLLHFDSNGLYELVDGKLVEKEMSFLAGKCAIRVGQILQNHVDATRVGDVASELSIQCFPNDPELIRRPDIAFFIAARSGAIPSEGHVRIAPDLAIEIISPGDKINAFEDKLADYRSAQIKLVWEVNPTFRYVRVHHPDRTTVFLEENDTLTGETAMPGFSVKVAELMPAL